MSMLELRREPLRDDTHWLRSVADALYPSEMSVAYGPEIFVGFQECVHASELPKALNAFYEALRQRGTENNALKDLARQTVGSYSVLARQLYEANSPMAGAMDEFVFTLTGERISAPVESDPATEPELLRMLLFEVGGEHLIVKPVTTGVRIGTGYDRIMSVQNFVIGPAETVRAQDVTSDERTRQPMSREIITWRDPPVAVLYRASEEYFNAVLQQMRLLGLSITQGASREALRYMSQWRQTINSTSANYFRYDDNRDLGHPVRTTVRSMSSAPVIAAALQL